METTAARHRRPPRGHGTEVWRCRVLVVDDDALVRARLAALLRKSHFEVESAACAEDALRIMTDARCQILLTDWEMPGMGGLSLCRKVRARYRKSYVYLLIHTARGGKEDLLAGLAAGVDDYVVKGTAVEQFLGRMEVARRIAQHQSANRH